jgi:hypothetical protein
VPVSGSLKRAILGGRKVKLIMEAISKMKIRTPKNPEKLKSKVEFSIKT